MLLFRNKKDFQKDRNKVPEILHSEILNDLKIIENEYPVFTDDYVKKYGPIVVLFDRSELRELHKQFPVIKKLSSEYIENIKIDDSTIVKKHLYILTDTGIITYERNQKW